LSETRELIKRVTHALGMDLVAAGKGETSTESSVRFRNLKNPQN